MGALTQKQRNALEIQDGHGKLLLLAIGINKYHSTAFPSLDTCENDAQSVRDAFRDVPQLNADRTRLTVMTSLSEELSRGKIRKAIKDFAASANPEERILFYFSGHGHRIKSEKDKLFLVPQDANDDDDPTALIDFDELRQVLGGSLAKQKLIIIDACMSGAIKSGKKFLPKQYSESELIKYLKNTRGTTCIYSSTADQASSTKSPDPKLSLFTYFFLRGLRGDPKALDTDKVLTVNGLFEYVSTEVPRYARSRQITQIPVIENGGIGVAMLADYSAIIPEKTFDFGIAPIEGVSFEKNESFRVDRVLTSIKYWQRHQQHYLENRVNENLGDYLRESLGRIVAALHREMGFDSSVVGVTDTSVDFPHGEYEVTYEADDKKSGWLVHTVSLKASWLQTPERIGPLLRCFGMTPDSVTFKLSSTISPETLIAGLEAQNWSITSQLPEKVEADRDGVKMAVEVRSLTFSGVRVSELFKEKPDSKALVARGVLGLLG